jgi:hypothetical protein
MNKYNSRQKYGTGWFNESHRHSLARQGIKTSQKINYSTHRQRRDALIGGVGGLLVAGPIGAVAGAGAGYVVGSKKEKKVNYAEQARWDWSKPETFHRYGYKWTKAYGNEYIYNENKEKLARIFFIKRFGRDPDHPVERSYFDEWRYRFYSGHPMSYMDNKSQSVYTKILSGDTKLPKGWKGKGGQSLTIVQVYPKVKNFAKGSSLEGWVEVDWKDSSGNIWMDNIPKSTLSDFEKNVRKSGGIVKKINYLKPEVKGQQLRIRMLNPKRFTTFKTKDVGEKGKLQLLLGHSKKEGWKTQSYRLNLSDYKSFDSFKRDLMKIKISPKKREQSLRQALKYYNKG